MIFPCTQCGLCCQNIAGIEQLKDFDLGNGVCKFFNKQTHGCDIYENRPDICQVDKMFELEFYSYFTKIEFYRENAKVCNQLQKKANLDKKFTVIIGD